MRAWETIDVADGPMHDFAQIWRAAEKVVYSTTLPSRTDAARTTIRPRFDPNEVRHLLETTDRDVTIGGPTLAASALRAGLVNEIQQLISPVVVGGGIRFLPDDVRIDLELIDERRFENGVVFVRYAVTR
jgi:dihydrofolate reductase